MGSTRRTRSGSRASSPSTATRHTRIFPRRCSCSITLAIRASRCACSRTAAVRSPRACSPWQTSRPASTGARQPARGSADAPRRHHMTAASSAQQTTERVVRAMAQAAVDNEARFSELDSVVGDGDFGFSLARGFEKVLAELDGLDRSSPGTFLKKVGLIITSRCGGTSGPLWGTAFLRAGAALGERSDLGPTDAVAALRAAFGGIAQRGGAALGDKTLLDALGPFTDALEAGLGSGSPAEVTQAL